jgi:hypothetical protein
MATFRCLALLLLLLSGQAEAEGAVCEQRFATSVKLIAGVYPELLKGAAVVVSFDTSTISIHSWLGDTPACDPGFIGVRLDEAAALHKHAPRQHAVPAQPPLASAVLQFSREGAVVGVDIGESTAKHRRQEADAKAALMAMPPGESETDAVLANAGARFRPSDRLSLRHAADAFFASVSSVLGPVEIRSVEFIGVESEMVRGEERRHAVLLWDVRGKSGSDEVTALFEPFEGRLRSYRRGSAIPARGTGKAQ